jgi:hypothetical protein
VPVPIEIPVSFIKRIRSSPLQLTKARQKLPLRKGDRRPRGDRLSKDKSFLSFGMCMSLIKRIRLAPLLLATALHKLSLRSDDRSSFGNLCAVGKAYQITAFAVDNTVIACSVYRRLTQLVRLVIDGCEPL